MDRLVWVTGFTNGDGGEWTHGREMVHRPGPGEELLYWLILREHKAGNRGVS